MTLRTEITCRIDAGSKCLLATHNLLKVKQIYRCTKVNIYKTTIEPVCDVRIRDMDANYGKRRKLPNLKAQSIQENIRSNRRCSNEKIQNSYKQREIKYKRLQWAGHVRRLPDRSTVKLVWEEAPVYKKLLNRPRLRWRHNITKDLRAMCVQNRLNAISDRQQRRTIVNSAKTHPGL